MKNIAKAFVAAKRQFAPALKTATNPHFKSRYADLAGCMEAVNDALLDQGIALYQETSEDSTGVTVETVFLHESGETFRGGKLHVPASKQDPQGYGSALTYARRYSVMAACGIAAEDDDGNAAAKAKAAAEAKAEADAKLARKSVNQISEQDLNIALNSVAHAQTLDDLKNVYTEAIKFCGADDAAKAHVIASKNQRKEELSA
jgi:hypothetical protein